jgi:hypothetical protein
MNIYTHAVSSKKRQAQSKVVEMIRGFGQSKAAESAGISKCVFSCVSPDFHKPPNTFGMNGGTTRLELATSAVRALRE